MSNLLNIFSGGRSSSVLGVDIGTTSIKVVEVKPGNGRPEIVNYGLLESSGYLARANQALQTSALKIFEADAIELLKTVLREMHPRATQAVASLPPFSAFTTVFDFPAMEAKEIEQAIVYQAKQYVPLPLSEVALDWMKVGEYQDEKGFAHEKILLISVPKEQIQKYQQMFAAAGLTLRELELESLSIARVWGTDATPSIVVDIGSRSTNIVFLENGKLAWNAQTDFAGASLTQALATSLNINPLRAEELKKERGIVGTGPNYELSTIMLPFLDAILNEVKKAQAAYHAQFSGAKPAERMILSGGGAGLLGIEQYCAREFSIPVIRANPFSRFSYAAAVEPLVPALDPVMTVALGLGLKGIQ